MRQGPSTETEVVAQVGYPNRYPLLAKNGDASWYLIDFGGGQGWVSATYARYEGDLNTVPVQ